MIQIAICSPIHSGGKPWFIQSLGRMIARTYAAKIEQEGKRVPVAVDTMVYSCSNVAFARRKLAETALGWGAHWLMWLDADHIFPPDTLLRLIARNKPIIGADYRRRLPDVMQTTTIGLDGQPVDSKAEGIEEVAHLGLGVCLVGAGVFRQIEPPYFYDEMLPDGSYVGEDVAFFRKTRAAGIPAFVDHDLSREVAHTADSHLRLP